MSVVEAWTLWFSGHLSPDLTLWGVSVFWWGRLGKIMQFVGAITIVADIIGPEKIRRFGASLHATVMPFVLVQFLKDCFEWYVVIFRRTLMKDYTPESMPEQAVSRRSKLDIFNYIICVLLTVIAVLFAELKLTEWTILIEAAIIYCCLLVSVSPIITVLIIITMATLGLVINSVFIKPLAWGLEHPLFDRFTKLASLLLLLLGFHFELLAS